MKEPPAGTIQQGMRALAQVGRVLTGRQIAGRNLTVFPDDFFLTSYPRSGNTWARFLISNLIYQEAPTTFANIEQRIPEIYFNSDHRMRALLRPRILKSHECFQPNYPNVIYIVRDPRDVAVSFYHHNVKAGNIPDDYPMDDFVPRFLAAEFDRKWGSWADHVQSWIMLRGNSPSFILLRYEDMKKNTMEELARLIAFLGQRRFRSIDRSPEKLQRAIELSSPERMRQLEKEQSGDWVLTKKTRTDKPFVRTATSGGWKNTLSPASVKAIETAWGALMESLGYVLASSASNRQQVPSDDDFPSVKSEP
jgi:Sulfotransferase domain